MVAEKGRGARCDGSVTRSWSGGSFDGMGTQSGNSKIAQHGEGPIGRKVRL